MKFILVVVLLVLNFSVQAHTWNEPWHKEVVEKADSFGLYEVVKNSNFSLKLKRVKHLAGKKN